MQSLLSVEQFDIFLTPLSEAFPAGEYLKSNRALYRPMRNAYNIAQTSLQKLSLNPDPEELDELVAANQDNWLQLQTLLIDTLQHQSRDLECMVWLAMAQLFTDKPYSQLALAIQLIDRSLHTFGENIQPFLPADKLRSSDQEGAAKERAELQSRPLKLLFGGSEDSCQIAVPLRMLPLVSDINFVRYRREEANRSSLKRMVRSGFTNEQSEVLERVNAMQDVLDALDSLDKTLAEHFKNVGMVAPGSRFLRHGVEINLQALQDLTDGLIIPWPPDIRRSNINSMPEKQAEEPLSGSDSNNTADSIAELQEEEEGLQTRDDGALNMQMTGESISFNRDQAFQQLRLLSDYFHRTEPQSPVSYLLEKTIRWGYTPLPELMNELLQGNTSSLNYITELTGMNLVEKVLIPGQPISTLSPIPSVDISVSTAKLETPSDSKADSPLSNSTEKDATEREEIIVPRIPEEKTPEATPPPASMTGPGGLAISNLDDLV
ncbi:hypothetical protein ACH42_10315 [Endozoicomonas sp. (ex Bugula neritina AB1)]|nr:hypothetical protein ACH42_10315 [Endozoicomonas sp. (ex Bugula neritina AB1)]